MEDTSSNLRYSNLNFGVLMILSTKNMVSYFDFLTLMMMMKKKLFQCFIEKRRLYSL